MIRFWTRRSVGAIIAQSATGAARPYQSKPYVPVAGELNTSTVRTPRAGSRVSVRVARHS